MGSPHAAHRLCGLLPPGVGQHHLHPGVGAGANHGQDRDGRSLQLLGTTFTGFNCLLSHVTPLGEHVTVSFKRSLKLLNTVWTIIFAMMLEDNFIFFKLDIHCN